MKTLSLTAAFGSPPDKTTPKRELVEVEPQADLEAKPVAEVCRKCKLSCKQFYKVQKCPRFDPLKPPATRARKKGVS